MMELRRPYIFAAKQFVFRDTQNIGLEYLPQVADACWVLIKELFKDNQAINIRGRDPGQFILEHQQESQIDPQRTQDEVLHYAGKIPPHGNMLTLRVTSLQTSNITTISAAINDESSGKPFPMESELIKRIIPFAPCEFRFGINLMRVKRYPIFGAASDVSTSLLLEWNGMSSLYYELISDTYTDDAPCEDMRLITTLSGILSRNILEEYKTWQKT